MQGKDSGPSPASSSALPWEHRVQTEVQLRQKCVQPVKQRVSRRHGRLSSFIIGWCVSSLKPALE